MISPQPKPKSRATVKARHKREEAKVMRVIRAACVARDGHCRLLFGVPMNGDTYDRAGLDACGLRSEWAHLEEKRRFKTRGMTPAHRHTTAGSVMLCDVHHHMVDAHELQPFFLSALGADGPIAWERQ